MTHRPSRPFDPRTLELLRDPEQVALYLEESFAEGGEALFQLALRDVAKAQEGAFF